MSLDRLADGDAADSPDGDAESVRADDDTVEPAPAPTAVRAQHRKPRSRGRKILIGTLVGALVVVLGVVAAGWYLSERYLGNVDRIAGVFDGLDESERPDPAPVGANGEAALTYLLVGSDKPYYALPEEDQVATRSDVIIMLRISGDRQNIQFISIPRDSWVPIPGRESNKINDAFAVGGPTLLVRTVEALTDVRIDHYAAINFENFVDVTDALGGVDVNVAETVAVGETVFEAGVNHLNGEEALTYVRQRYGLPGGDLDRVQRQQSYLRGMLGGIFAQDLLGDLGRTDDLLVALTSAVSVDDALSNVDLLQLAYSLRGVTADTVSFFTAPVAGRGREGIQDVLYLDEELCDRLWGYLREDSLPQHAAEFSAYALPEIPR